MIYVETVVDATIVGLVTIFLMKGEGDLCLDSTLDLYLFLDLYLCLFEKG